MVQSNAGDTPPREAGWSRRQRSGKIVVGYTGPDCASRGHCRPFYHPCVAFALISVEPDLTVLSISAEVSKWLLLSYKCSFPSGVSSNSLAPLASGGGTGGYPRHPLVRWCRLWVRPGPKLYRHARGNGIFAWFSTNALLIVTGTWATCVLGKCLVEVSGAKPLHCSPKR